MARKTAPAENRRDSKGASERVARPAPRKGEAKGPSQRQLRVAEEVRHALSGVFAREEFRDPDLKGLRVTVTEVRASPDLKHMTAFISGLGQDVTPVQFAGLRRVTPFLRAQVSRAVQLRAVPDLHFEPDVALDYAMHINKVMQQPAVQRDLAAAPAEPPVEDD